MGIAAGVVALRPDPPPGPTRSDDRPGIRLEMMGPRPVVGIRFVGRDRPLGLLTVTSGRITVGVMEIRVGRPLASVVEMRLLPVGVGTGGRRFVRPEMRFVRGLPLLVGRAVGIISPRREERALLMTETGRPFVRPLRAEEMPDSRPEMMGRLEGRLPRTLETTPGEG